MSTKTFLLESNNSSGKLFNDRARKESRIGKNYVAEKNSQWTTTINQGGLQINPGDTISISSTQINLRGEPDQCLEFSGSTNSTFKAAISDNKASTEFGYYITNRQQYNMNLPLANQTIAGPKDWFTRHWGLQSILADDHTWSDFSKSYPYVAIEGCARRHCSTPFGSVNTWEGCVNGIVMEWWDLITTEDPTQDTEFGQSGMYYAGTNTHTPIANSNFEIATPNETRMYVCKDNYTGLLPKLEDSAYPHIHGPIKYSDTLLTQTIDFEVPEGFTTPTALGSDLTTTFHQRTGDADNWTTRDVQAEVYVHNAMWGYESQCLRQTRGVSIPQGALGYFWDWTLNKAGDPDPTDPTRFNLRKIPVSDVTDNSYITVRTAGGALLDKIWRDPEVDDSVSKWNTSAGDFGANIPNNTKFNWNGGDGTWGSNYLPENGRQLFYNNLLTGDINRTQSIEIWNSLTFVTYNEYGLTDKRNTSFYTNWIQELEDGVYSKYGSYRGSSIRWTAGPNYTPPALPPPPPYTPQLTPEQELYFQGIFGQQICVMDNYNSVRTGYSDSEQGEVGMELVRNNTTVEDERLRFDLQPEAVIIDAIEPGYNFQVMPINLVASPMNIAILKKALYRSRELLPDSKVSLEDTTTWAEDYVTRLDLGVKDDSMCINANIPNGYSDPNKSANMIAVPNPYMVAQAYLHNYDPTTLPPTQPNVIPEGFTSYNPINIQTTETGMGNTGNVFNRVQRIAKDGRQNKQQKNSVYCRTFWNEDCDPKNEKIDLPENSQFSFTNGNGEMPDYTRYFRPGGLDGAPKSVKWEDGNEAGLDEGVGLCVVYFNNKTMTDLGLDVVNTQNIDRNKYYTDINYPAAGASPPGMDGNTRFRTLVPMLALVVPKLNVDNNYRGLTYYQRVCPCPYIGEMIGFSSAFSDGKYSKVVTTQRVNPKFYETINDSVGDTNKEYGPQAFTFDSQYYNIYDYYPYIHVGAIDPKIQFSSVSGRFEMTRLHTPATSSSGPWQEPAGSGASGQSADEVILMNSRRSFLSHVSATCDLKGFTKGRLATVEDIHTESQKPINETWALGRGGTGIPLAYGISDGLMIVPWAELHQDTIRQKTISSQSGLGLLNYIYYQNGENNTLVPNYVNAYQPQLFNETMFAKMGYTIEQLMPFAGKQNSNFNRSNYNMALGIDVPLSNKLNNMVFPFTTNGYSTAEQSFSTVTNSWVGYDTLYNVNGETDKTGDLAKGEPPTSNKYSFYQTASVAANISSRPFLVFQTDSADNSTTNLKQLPADEAITMFSLGGNNFGTESVATVDSDALIANGLPSKFNYSYLVIYSDIVGQTSNFITGSNIMVTTPAIGYMTRNYSSADFMYSFDSDFNYIADRSFLLNNFNVEIRQPNGRLANIENNSTIIFKVVKNIRPILPIPPPVPKQIMAEEKEEQKEMDLTIAEFV